jgi:hypothetical protein
MEQYGITASKGEYKPTNDINPIVNKVYYISIGENAYAACDKEDDFTADGKFKEDVTYYEFYAYCTINNTTKSIVGTYAAVISNNVSGKAPSATRTNNWIIPSPKVITYNTDLSENNNIIAEVYFETEDDECDLAKTYYTKTEKGLYEIADIVEFAPDVVYYEKDNVVTLQIAATPDNNDATLTYAWYYTDTLNGDMTPIEGATQRSHDIRQPGWYQVITTSTLNREDITKGSQIAKVTLPPVVPTVNYQGGEAKIVNINFNNIENDSYPLTVSAEIEEGPLSSERLSYTWLHQAKEADGVYEDVVVGEYGVKEISNNVLTVSYTGDQEIFVCKVTNHLNGVEAFSYSDKYNIMKA